MTENMVDGIEVGQWYRDRDGELFKVVAVEEQGGAAEIQLFDGTVVELGLRDWRERRPRATEAPEDWSGGMDISGEDFRTSNDEENDTERGNPLDRLDRL